MSYRCPFGAMFCAIGTSVVEIDRVFQRARHERHHLERPCHRRKLLWVALQSMAHCADMFRWRDELYDVIFHVCVSLTNYLVTMHSLREDNGNHFRQHHNRFIAIGEEIRKKRRLSQENHRRSKRLRYQMELDDHPANDNFSDLSDGNLSDGDESVVAQLSIQF